MPDDTTPEQLRIAHRRGHDTLMHERAREDIARANVLVTDNGAVLEVGELFDGEMLVVDGDQIVSEPIPGGGGGSVDVSDITGLGAGVEDWLINPAAGNLRAAVGPASGTGELVFNTNTTLVTPNLGTPSAVNLANATNLPAASVIGGTFVSALAADLVFGTTPVNLFTVTLPAAGTYLLEGDVFVTTGTMGATRTITFDCQCTNQTSFTVSRGVAVSSVTASTGKISAPGTFTVGNQASNARSMVRLNGYVVVSAAGVFTIAVNMSGDTNTILTGAYLRACRLS